MTNSIIPSGKEKVTVKMGKVDSVIIYQVKEGELEKLEKGSPSSIFLNFAILTFSVAVSFLIALLTTNIESNRTFIFFLVITVIGFICGTILLILWWRDHESLKLVVEEIKKRV